MSEMIAENQSSSLRMCWWASHLCFIFHKHRVGYCKGKGGRGLALHFSDPDAERVQILVSVIDQDQTHLCNHLVSFTTDNSSPVPRWDKADHSNKERNCCNISEKGSCGGYSPFRIFFILPVTTVPSSAFLSASLPDSAHPAHCFSLA